MRNTIVMVARCLTPLTCVVLRVIPTYDGREKVAGKYGAINIQTESEDKRFLFMGNTASFVKEDFFLLFN